MANTMQSKKRVRQSEKRRNRNASAKSMLRTALKNTENSILSGDLENSNKCFLLAQKILDNFASKNLVHKNYASRKKSRLNRKIKNLFQINENKKTLEESN